MRSPFDYDLIAIDLDGTLLGSDHRLPVRNRTALHRAHEAGLKLVLCTGRSLPETQPVIDEIGLDLDAAITAGGAIVTDLRAGRTLERAALDATSAAAATAWFARRGHACIWLYDREVEGFDGYLVDGPRRHPAYDRWLQVAPCDVHCVNRLPVEAPPPVRISVVDDTPVLRALVDAFAAEFGGRVAHNLLEVNMYHFSVLEMFAAHVSKWYAIERLCARWRVGLDRTVAIGDDVNDLAMVRSAALGAAVANAHPTVKAVAGREVASNDGCGVAELIEALLSRQALPR